MSHSYHHHAHPAAPPSDAFLPAIPPYACPDRALEHRQRLESLLDSALATLSLIHDSATAPVSYSDRVTDVLKALNRRIFVVTSVTAPLAPHPAPHPAPVCPSDTPSPQRAPTNATYARAVSAEPPTPPASPSPLHHDPATDPSDSDIIVRLDLDASEPARAATSVDPREIFRAIRASIASATGQRLFAGVRWTRNGNLAIQIERDTGTTAYMIDTYAHKLWAVLRPLLHFPVDHPHPPFDTGDSWHSVVFHNVPTLRQRNCYTLSGIRDSLRSGGFDHAVKAFAILCDDVEFDRRQAAFLGVPMRVSVLTATAAQQLIRDGGNLIGGRCKATHYIPRRRDSTPVVPESTPAPTTGADNMQ
ncbi:hypothetical protein GGX14DRAFT_567520 [Mycena pura]|uniref:Uncharacterized protein n=1 Tax=Mycena pura TaxID=153505 RepID=A0AAD6YBL6_9AGAR|nr:hypothetical protein GGX14DRAFT_567520 [Mycena pura]